MEISLCKNSLFTISTFCKNIHIFCSLPFSSSSSSFPHILDFQILKGRLEFNNKKQTLWILLFSLLKTTLTPHVILTGIPTSFLHLLAWMTDFSNTVQSLGKRGWGWGWEGEAGPGVPIPAASEPGGWMEQELTSHQTQEIKRLRATRTTL